jgi:CHAT domain-containing protein/tetratricopeptide (TPR) repeat protein
MGLKPLVTVETLWKCHACGTARPVPAHLLVSIQREDTWRAVDELLIGTCGNCGQRGAPAQATALLQEGQAEDQPGFLLLPVQGTPSLPEAEQARSFLNERLPLVLVDGLVPVGWPTGDEDAPQSVLDALEADPEVATRLADHKRRRKVIAALLNLIATTSPDQVRGILTACPELVADGMEAERELRSALQWPPEAGRLATALTALISALTPSVTDAELTSLYEAFAAERQSGIAEIVEAGHQKGRWLVENPAAPAAEWDAVAVEALHLLGLGGDEQGRVELLHHVGVRTVRRSDTTPGQAEWAIQCLRESKDLWRKLGNGDKAAAVSSNLGAALHAWEYGDVLAKMSEAEEVMREVVAYYTKAQQTGLLALAMTNLSVVLLKTATLDQRDDRIQEAVDLCRKALPLRPKDVDPLGWAFTAGNLALALTRLANQDAATRRSNLAEAAEVGLKAATILEAQGDIPAADQARVNRLDALLGVARGLRDERLQAVVGGDDTLSPRSLGNLLTVNPGWFGLAETPPEVAAITLGPAAPDEERILRQVLDEAAALLAQQRTVLNPAARSKLARIAAMAWPMLLGPTQEAVAAVAVSRRLIDDIVAPDAAASTSSELADLLVRLNRWPEAAAAYDACLTLNERMLHDHVEHGRAVQIVARFPTLARWTAYAHVRSGDPEKAITILERTRSRTLPRFVPGAGRGLELLSWRSATIDDIGRAASPTCPIAYVLTAPAGSAVLLVRRGNLGDVRVTVHESPLSSAFLVAQIWSITRPEQGFLTAQLANEDVGPAVRALMEPLGSLLQPVVNELLGDEVRDLILIPAGPSAAMPWAAAMARTLDDSPLVPIVDLLNVSVAPSAAAVVLGRERARGRAHDTFAGRILVVADPERKDVMRLAGAREEAQRIQTEFPGRVDMLLGADARTETVLDLLPSCWAAHLACHGVNEVLQPESMRLLLSDGDLKLDQLLKLPELRARLIVLSACQSGHVDIVRASDEMLGMPLAFLQAGACTVVSTLWPVSDQVTAILIGRFYEELAGETGTDEGKGDIAAALARAQRWLRSLPREEALALLQGNGSGEPPLQRSVVMAPAPSPHGDALFADPYFWAGFVAYGR